MREGWVDAEFVCSAHRCSLRGSSSGAQLEALCVERLSRAGARRRGFLRVRRGRDRDSLDVVTAEAEAIGRAISRLAQATGDEPPAYWQALLDDLAPFV